MDSELIGYRAEVDISIQVKQKGRDSYLAISNSGLRYCVCLPANVKHSVMNKKRFQDITDKKSKMHAVLIYFCIHKFLKELAKLKICPDGSNPRTLNKYLLDFLFNDLEKEEFHRIKPKFKGVDSKSNAHKHANYCRKNKQVDLILTLDDVEKIILEM